ncbi:hypothetical protein Hanom_Chr01g00046181 [Helianthus anomalus]
MVYCHVAYSIATIFSYAASNDVIFWLIDKYGSTMLIMLLSITR